MRAAWFLTVVAAGVLSPAWSLAQDTRPTDPGMEWSPSPVPQGTIFQVFVPGELVDSAAGPGAVEGEFAGEPLHFHGTGDGRYAALAAAPVDTEGELPLRVRITTLDGAVADFAPGVQVVPGDYRMQELTVAPEFGRPQPPDIQRRIDDEFARAMEVSRRSHESPRMWGSPFVLPREARITSGFGHGRVFNGQVQSRHTGTDFQGTVGAPIVAPARGIAALVDEFYLGGNVIYLDHGAGLVTAYLHLSDQEVEEGDVVEPGQLIGRVGATGRVTGPHLHWIVRYGEVSVAGMSLLGLESP